MCNDQIKMFNIHVSKAHCYLLVTLSIAVSVSHSFVLKESSACFSYLLHSVLALLSLLHPSPSCSHYSRARSIFFSTQCERERTVFVLGSQACVANASFPDVFHFPRREDPVFLVPEYSG